MSRNFFFKTFDDKSYTYLFCGLRMNVSGGVAELFDKKKA
jgi:hypothetical protein